jgi:hypothetical protein
MTSQVEDLYAQSNREISMHQRNQHKI